MDRRQVLKAGAAMAALGPVGALAQLQGNAFLVSGFPAGGMGDFVAQVGQGGKRLHRPLRSTI